MGLDVIVYADDLLIGGKDQEEHDRLLHLTLKRLSKFGLKLNKDKIIVSVPEVDFLGFHIGGGMFDLERYCASKAAILPVFSHYKQLERVLGAMNFCRSHVVGLSQLIIPLNEAKIRAQKNSALCSEAWWS